MKEFTFTILGNQEDPQGNPLGYHRTTQKSKWSEGSQRYERWKDYVRGEFEKATHYFRERAGTLSDLTDIHPLTSDKKLPAKVHMDIEFANDSRPDPDNVFKGILDALFLNDKYVFNGSYAAKMSPDKVGKVTVQIISNVI